MLGKVVSKVGRAFIPIDEELLLVDTILYPKEAHIDGLGTASVYCADSNQKEKLGTNMLFSNSPQQRFVKW